MWIARDKSGFLGLYLNNKPTKSQEDFDEYLGICSELPEHMFPELTWNDEPKKVELYDKDEIFKLIEDVVDYCRRFGISDVTPSQCFEHLFASTNEK